ncbi:major royal jelly protein 2-like [Leptopilina heterotoma]|uniref:major royal jelly protein 2-like n=1 Tax=Leptopilina heterotoma TaxID=63436 RepID=UPI001CA8D289|nr:major royal jelly protein 2-like [Leptopilina heterotoma]
MFFSKICCLLFFFILISENCASKMDILYEWKYVDYLWKNSEQRERAINSGYRNKSIIIDVDQASDGRMFVTVIGTDTVPASVNTISNQKSEAGPLLKPYPDWSWYENNQNCSGITSVFRVAIKCNRLWILDNGKFGAKQVCPAQLLIFNLADDHLVKKVMIPDNFAANSQGVGLLITPIVQTMGMLCEPWKSNVFMAEVEVGALVVYNNYQRTMWRIEGKEFEAEPKFSNHTIAGDTFHLPDALFGMALSPPTYNRRSQYLALSKLSSRNLYIAQTSEVLNSYYTRNLRFEKFENIFPSEITTMAFSSKGVLFFGQTTEIAIGCWNSHKKLIPQNLDTAAQDDKTLQFTSGMKIINRWGEDEKLLIATNRFQKFYLDKMNFNEINYRILSRSVKSLISNTKCNNYRL